RLDEGVVTNKDAELLPADMQDLIKELFPGGTNHREVKIPEEAIPHTKWVDSRLLGETGAPIHLGKATSSALSAINTPVRFTTLSLRPAYALNLLGNHAMLWFDQGFTTSLQNYARALHLTASDGEANAAMIHRLVGAGKARSYETGYAGRVTRSVAEFWN